MTHVPTPMISRSSIFILAYFLVNSGLNYPLPYELALTWVRLGIIGLMSFMALEWVASRRDATLASALGE